MEDTFAVASLVLSVLGVILVVWFSASAKRDAERAQAVLDQVGEAVKGWQAQVMGSTIGILDSLPQVVEGKATLARLLRRVVLGRRIKPLRL
jgi:hypothetical protein